MNRRHAFAMLAGLIASQAAPYKLRAQDAEVTLTSPDNDAVWVQGQPGATFYVFPGGTVVAEDADGQNAEYLDQAKAVAAFTAAVAQLKKE
jgi:hypothetical protein